MKISPNQKKILLNQKYSNICNIMFIRFHIQISFNLSITKLIYNPHQRKLQGSGLITSINKTYIIESSLGYFTYKKNKIVKNTQMYFQFDYIMNFRCFC